jgi:hypothetical protein
VVVEMVVLLLLLVLEIHAGSTPRRDRSLRCVRLRSWRMGWAAPCGVGFCCGVAAWERNL